MFLKSTKVKNRKSNEGLWSKKSRERFLHSDKKLNEKKFEKINNFAAMQET